MNIKTMKTKERRKVIRRKPESMAVLLARHFQEDRDNFSDIQKQFANQAREKVELNQNLKLIASQMEKNNIFMENMKGFSEFVEGASLLKKPVIWFVALVIGIVALGGGIKTILAWVGLRNL